MLYDIKSLGHANKTSLPVDVFKSCLHPKLHYSCQKSHFMLQDSNENNGYFAGIIIRQ